MKNDGNNGGFRVGMRRLRSVARSAVEAVVAHVGDEHWEEMDEEDQDAVIEDVADNIAEMLGLDVEPEEEEE